jgi:hypothetical protein
VIHREQNPYIRLYFKPIKVTSHHVLEVTTVRRQAQLDAELRVIGGASQYRAVNSFYISHPVVLVKIRIL